MIVLADVRKLYDGASAEPSSVREGVDVVLDGDRIRAVEPHAPGRPTAEGDVVIDCRSHVVAPGLVDCHGHVTVRGLADADHDAMAGQEALLWVERILWRSLVDGGVTTMRDVGGATHRMKRLVEEGVLAGPRLSVAICMLSTTGGHADFRGPDRCHGELSRLWPPAPGRPSSLVDGPWECRKRVREIAACGADLIKVCASPGVASPSDRLEHRDFTAEELEAIVDEAVHRGLRVAAHAHSRSGIELAIRCGVHDLQHVSFLDAELAERAAERGCTVTPTSWIMDELERAEGLSPQVMDKVRAASEAHRRAVGIAAAAGLPILAGTDPVLPRMHGRNYMELVHLVRDGLPPLQAWHGATGLAAASIGAEDAGRLAPGMRADLLVASGDVVAEPELLARGALVEVVQGGVGHRGGLPGLPRRTFETVVERGLGPLPAPPEDRRSPTA